jgi:transcriptional regulator with XRE-family HTH domain
VINNLTIEQTAEMLQVTERTIAHWERGTARIPYSAFKLLRILANGELLPEPWKGWHVRADTLYTPSGRAFKAHELSYLSNYITMARYWLDECKRKLTHRQVLDLRPRLRLVTARTLDSIQVKK